MNEEENLEFGIRNSESEDDGDDTADEVEATDDEGDDTVDEVEAETSDDGGDDTVDEVEAVDTSSDVGGVILIDPAYSKRLPFSLLAGLLGAILGMIPAALCTYWFGSTFYPLFVAAPLLIFLFNKLFKGGCDIRTLFITAGFSLASAYVTALASQVAILMLHFNLPVRYLLPFTAEALAEPDLLPWPVPVYVYPLVFVALGVAITWELLRNEAQRSSGGELKQENGEPDDGAEDTTEAADESGGEDTLETADGELEREIGDTVEIANDESGGEVEDLPAPSDDESEVEVKDTIGTPGGELSD